VVLDLYFIAGAAGDRINRKSRVQIEHADPSVVGMFLSKHFYYSPRLKTYSLMVEDSSRPKITTDDYPL
jgi:hypothetical protein